MITGGGGRGGGVHKKTYCTAIIFLLTNSANEDSMVYVVVLENHHRGNALKVFTHLCTFLDIPSLIGSIEKGEMSYQLNDLGKNVGLINKVAPHFKPDWIRPLMYRKLYAVKLKIIRLGRVKAA